ncbi:MAG: tellurium resistance protein [Chloroflexi bacterium 54-19]|nr:MAG: tellurium resistance protein [Chloroflexi bacterium 54-19]
MPGGKLASRQLHFIWIVDCSSSMTGKKINMLNFAVREVIPSMKDVAKANPFAQVMVRALKFSSGAQWHIAQPTVIDDFKWPDLTARGVTDLGKALTLLAEELKVEKMPKRAFPPVLVLISDGQPTDNFKKGLDALMAQPWGKKAVRIAIGVEEDTDYEVLKQFIGNPEIEPLHADTPTQLLSYIKWASTEVLKAASAPASQTSDSKTFIPEPPTIWPGTNNKVDDVW